MSIDYDVNGDVVFMSIYNVSDNYCCTAIIDLADLALVKQKYSWSSYKVESKKYSRWRIQSGDGIYLGRWILGLVKGDPLEVIYLDRNTLNNRRSNLEKGLKFERVHRNQTSKYPGVRYNSDTKRYRVTVKWDNKLSGYCGDYKTEVEAAKVSYRFMLLKFSPLPPSIKEMFKDIL